MRRAAVWFAGVTGLVALAGHAAAATLPVPVPEVPPVQVPSVVLPLPTAPTLPAPAPTPPAEVQTPAVSTPTVQVPGGGGSPAAASGTGPAYSPGGGSAPSSSSTRGSRPSVQSFRTTRAWLGGSKRATTLTFVLPTAAQVYFTVVQVSPVCRPVGHFSYAGHAGFNRVRFDGRLGRQELGPGTYKISARTPKGRGIPRVTLVVVEADAPTDGELAAARTANVCAGVGIAAASSSSAAANAVNVERSLRPKSEPLAGGIPGKGANSHSGVLAASFEKTVEALRPIVVVLLALAIILLGVASLPRTAVPDERTHDILARHRVDLAGIGAAALVAVAVLFLLG